MDRMHVPKFPALFLACALLLAAPPASPSGEDVPRRVVHFNEVLLPHVEAELTDALPDDAWTEDARFRVGRRFTRWSRAGRKLWEYAGMVPGILAGLMADSWAHSAATAALGGKATALAGTAGVSTLFGSGIAGGLLGMAVVTFPVVAYVTPASWRGWTDCWTVRGGNPRRACALEDGALYAFPLDYDLTGPGGEKATGQCLLFLELDLEGGLLRWEVDGCVADGFWPGEEEPFPQDEEGGLRTGGWTGLLDWAQGHLDVTARGAVGLDTVPDGM